MVQSILGKFKVQDSTALCLTFWVKIKFTENEMLLEINEIIGK